MNQFPHMVQSSDCSFCGYAIVQGIQIPLSIQIPTSWRQGQSLQNVSISTLPAWYDQLKSIFPPLSAKLVYIRDLDAMFLELYSVLENHLNPAIHSEQDAFPIRYENASLLSELVLDLYRIEHVIGSVSANFKDVTIKLPIPIAPYDPILITINCSVASGYPLVAPVFTTLDTPALSANTLAPPLIPSQTPFIIPVPWSAEPSNRFHAYIDSVTQYLTTQYGRFWSQVLHIDQNARVKGPSSSSHVWRTLDLGNYISLELPIDPADPQSVETPGTYAKFIGPSWPVSNLEQKWRSRVFSFWDSSQSVLSNISLVLGLQVPGPLPQTMTSNDDEDGCAICYDDSNPEMPLSVVCSCGKRYHTDCLSAVFQRQAMSSSLKGGRLVGNCPACSNSLLVDM